MKLSFSLTSSKPPKPTRKSSEETQSQKQFVTEFDPSKPHDSASKSNHVIAPISNEWRPQKKMRNIDLPVKSDDPNLQFEVVNSMIEPVDPNITYGLNLRSKKDDPEKPNLERLQTSSIDNLMLNKLRNDLDRLPEDRGMDEFQDVPVEDFAAALLKGYGWYEGRGIGKNTKEDVKVVEYTKRAGKQGLGFVDDAPIPPTTNDSNPSTAKNSKNKSVGNGERRERIHVGKNDSNQNIAKDSKHKSIGNGEQRERTHVGKDDSSRVVRGKDSGSKRIREEQENRSHSVSWLKSHIRVRIISKELKRGRLYLQKGEIVDVVGPTTCDITMDNGRELIQGVEQDFLETALPRRGGPVVVLYGRHKGVYGSLQEKDMDKETAIVRDADTHALITVRLEQVAEYVGDLDEIEY